MCSMRYSVLSANIGLTIFGAALLLLAFATCADPFACLVMSGE